MDETTDYLPASTLAPLSSTGRVEVDQVQASGSPWTAVPAWLLPAVPSTAVVVFAAIGQHVRPGGPAPWPSLSRLAQLTGLHRDTVKRAVRKLETVGAVEVHRGLAWPDGRKAPNRYVLHLDERDARAAAVHRATAARSRR